MWMFSSSLSVWGKRRKTMSPCRHWSSTWFTFCVVWAVLLELCQDRAQCAVLAESSTFSQDPCPDTFKYLEVHYKCRPNEFERKTVCEGDQMELWCKKAKRLAIYSALFGRVPNDTGPCPPNRPGYINCQAAETVSEVRTACQGRKRCDIQASEAVFGNPCATGINKYLSVTFACVPKKILKQLRRHRGRLSPGRKRKKKKKNDNNNDNNNDSNDGQGQVTEVAGVASTGPEEDNEVDTTVTPSSSSPGEEGLWGSEPPVTGVVEVYHNTDAVEKASADSAASNKGGDPGAVPPHLLASTPTPPTLLVPVANREPPAHSAGADDNLDNSAGADDNLDNSAGADDNLDNSHPNVPRFHPDRASSVPDTDHFTPDLGHDLQGGGQNPDGPARPDPDPDPDRSGDSAGVHTEDSPNQNRDQLNPGRARDSPDSNRNYPAWNSADPSREKGAGHREVADPGEEAEQAGDNLLSATRPGQGGQSGREMATEASQAGAGSAGSVTGNMTVLCLNHTLGTVGVPTVRTLPNSNEASIGVVKELFSVVRFVQGQQEKAVLYLMLGVCLGLILLLSTVLGRVCYKLKHNTHAKLDLTEPTHSRNVSHLVHHGNHSLLETPMLEHSDSIDRIEVVRFEPRGTTRSGYHSTLHSDSGDRSLNNYYG